MITGDASSSEDVTSRVAYPDRVGESGKDEEQKTHIVRVPCNIAHSSPSTYRESWAAKPLHSTQRTCTTTIGQRSDLALASQVPHNRVTCTTGCRKRILDVMVPC